MTCKPIVILRTTFTWLVLIPGFLTASPATTEEPDVPCSADVYRAFDFWVGRWEVHLADGRRAGANRITLSDDGCLILEQWTGSLGGRGYSMNFYDPIEESWRQIWVSSDSVIEITGGLIESGEGLKSDSMVMTGRISDRKSGKGVPFRGRWTLLPDGRVRQFFEERREDTWEPWFEGFYTKVVE